MMVGLMVVRTGGYADGCVDDDYEDDDFSDDNYNHDDYNDDDYNHDDDMACWDHAASQLILLAQLGKTWRAHAFGRAFGATKVLHRSASLYTYACMQVRTYAGICSAARACARAHAMTLRSCMHA